MTVKVIVVTDTDKETLMGTNRWDANDMYPYFVLTNLISLGGPSGMLS